jgi:hypothetical protein
MMVDDALVGAVVKACPRLAYLCLAYCENLTDTGLFSIARLNGTLRHLIIACCPSVTGLGFVAILKNAPKLEFIDLSYCSSVDTDSISELAVNCPELLRVQINGCTVTDTCMFKLARGCKRVRRLHIASCFLLTNKTLKTIVLEWPSVRELRIFGCNMSTYEVMRLPCHLNVDTNPGYSWNFF